MNKIFAIILLLIIAQPMFAQKKELKTEPVPALKSDSQQNTDISGRNNNFYDDEETFILPGCDLTVEGEIENPGKVDFNKLARHSVIVKETVPADSGNKFIGAFRYDGFSLFDILEDRILKKKNSREFKPIIDVFVIIENKKGDKIILSWGEIYYPNNLHRIIIADRVMRIVPGKTKDLWPLPTESKLVVSNDLVTERNISCPSRITIVSYPRSYPVSRDLSPLVSETVNVFMANNFIEGFTNVPEKYPFSKYQTICYGKGREIHGIKPFTGILIKDYLEEKFKINRLQIMNGIVVFAAVDGYRSVFSFSELVNRNDQQDVLLVPVKPGEDGGNFRIFPACDFFCDRSVKALNEIRLEVIKPFH